MHFLSQSSKKEQKNPPSQKFLIFRRIGLSSSNIKKVLTFSQRKAFLMFSQKKSFFIFSTNRTLHFLSQNSQKTKNPSRNKFLIFQEMELSRPKPKKFLIFLEMKPSTFQTKLKKLNNPTRDNFL